MKAVTPWVLVTVLSVYLSSFSAAGDLPERAGNLLAELADEQNSVGMAVAVVRDGEVDLIRTYGRLSADTDRLVNEDTVFRIASLSKGMTASVVAQLVGEEKVALTAHARDFAPEIQLETSGATEALTLEHLLSHRTGLPPYAYDNLLEAGIPPLDIRHRYAEVSSICPVGTCYSYQNVLFDAVTPLIEQVEERALASSLEARLFSPLNMTRTSLGTDGLKKDDNWARPHRRRKRGPWHVVGVKQAYYNVPAAGGVNSSIRDMARWLRAQMGYEQAVLSQDELALIHAPRVKTLAELRRTRRSMRKLESAHYGLGWRIYRFAGESVVSHFGGVDGGYLAQLSFMPEHDVGIVLLTNSPSKAFMKVLPTFLEEELKL